MADRRTSSRRPGSPGGRPGVRSTARSRPAAGPVAARSDRSRPTGRAVVLLVVLGVLAVSWASSMRAHLEQQRHLSELRASIAASESAIEDLRREKRRWQDPAYVETQARKRLGFVMPGETSYQVIGRDGEPLAPEATLSEPAAEDEVPPPWWAKAWGAVESAGAPPEDEQDQPADRIRAPKQPRSEPRSVSP